MKMITLLALILSLSACSLSNSKKEEVAVHNDDLEFAVDTLADQPSSSSDEFKVEEQKIAEAVVPDDYQAPPVQENEVAMTAPEEPKFEDFKKPAESADQIDEMLANNNTTVEAPAKINLEEKPLEHVAPVRPVDPIAPMPPVVAEVVPEVMSEDRPVIEAHGPMETYRVQKGDTLMMVAFKIYGDYRKWKELKVWNSNVKKVSEGIELKYQVPERKFGWSPMGLPYMVKTGDTLQIVSMDKYGTTRKWKSIYENNRPLIRDPNLIFAGFTIYYQPARDLASEPK